jgi:peptide/nickel transport system ATP-binding protein
VFEDPKQPYTKGLMQSFPSISGPKLRLVGIAGSPPDLLRPPSGCRFHPRCPSVMPRCHTEEPAVHVRPNDLVKCHLYSDGR